MYKVTIEVDPVHYGGKVSVDDLARGAVETAKAVASHIGASFVTVRVNAWGTGMGVADKVEADLKCMRGLAAVTVERVNKGPREAGACAVTVAHSLPGKQRVSIPEGHQGGEHIWVDHLTAKALGIRGKALPVESACALYPAAMVRAAWERANPQQERLEVVMAPQGLHGNGRVEHTGQPQPERLGGYHVWVDNFTADRLDIVRHAIASRYVLPGHLFYPVEVVRAAMNSTQPATAIAANTEGAFAANGDHVWVGKGTAKALGILQFAMPSRCNPSMPGCCLLPTHMVAEAMNSTRLQPEHLEGWCPTCKGVESLGHRGKDCPEASKPGGGWTDRKPQEQPAAPFLAGMTDQEVVEGARRQLNALRAQLPDTEATRWARTMEQVMLYHQALLEDTRKGDTDARDDTPERILARCRMILQNPNSLGQVPAEGGGWIASLLRVVEGHQALLEDKQVSVKREVHTVNVPVPEGGAAVSITQTTPKQRVVHYYRSCGEWTTGDLIMTPYGTHPPDVCQVCKEIADGRAPK